MAKDDGLKYLGECIREGLFKLAEAIDRKTDLEERQNKRLEIFQREAQKLQKEFLDKMKNAEEEEEEGEDWKRGHDD